MNYSFLQNTWVNLERCSSVFIHCLACIILYVWKQSVNTFAINSKGIKLFAHFILVYASLYDERTTSRTTSVWKCSSCSNWVWVYTQKMRTGRPQPFAFLKGGFWIYVFTVHSAPFKSTFPYINTLMRVAFQRKLCQQRLFNFHKYVWRFLNIILINIPCILKEIVLLLIWNLLMLYRALSCIIPQQNLSTFRYEICATNVD